MVFKGQGGAVGFAQGRARVTLEEHAGETVVRYTAEAHIGGRLAQLGSRMIESVARRSSDQFFSAFQRVVGELRDGAAPQVEGTFGTPVAHAVADVVAAGADAHRVAARGAGLAYLVPAWWLFVAAAVGAGLAMAAFVGARWPRSTGHDGGVRRRASTALSRAGISPSRARCPSGPAPAPN